MTPSDGLIRVFLCAFLCMFCVSPPVEAKPAPESEKTCSFPLSPDAKRLIEPIDQRELVDDAKFLATLRLVLDDPKLDTGGKIDAFFLMLRKIGWDFTGTVRIFPHSNYLQTYTGMAATYLGYQHQLEFLGYDVFPILQQALTDYERNAVRSSYGLLLAALVNPKQTVGTIRSFSDASKIKSSEMPPIILHNLSLSVVLSRDFKLAEELGNLLQKIKIEEGQEDILCTLSIFHAKEIAAIVYSFLQEALKYKYDAAVETGILVMQKILPPDEFRTAYDKLVAGVEDPGRKKRLLELKQEGFDSLRKFGPGEGWVKTWDGVDLILYDDGIAIHYGPRFRDYKPK